jgi:hypothetical protein
MNPVPERHLSVDSFSAYLRAGAPIEHPVPGTPRLHLFIDPERVRIGLRGPAGPRESPTPTGLEHVTVRAVHHNGQRLMEIEVRDASLFVDAYPVLCAVADRVQLDGQPITAALTATLRRLGHLLRPENILPRELEIGLLGELIVLSGLVRVIGTANSLASWRGAQAEEHDFDLGECDLEVKTTTSERRGHWIASLSQLEPTGDRLLWLLSCQITAAGTSGRTLPELVERTRALFVDHAERDRFDRRLSEAGWSERFVATCRHRWRLRSTMTTYCIRVGFPRLSAGRLQDAGVNLAHISDVRYRVDLTGWPADHPPAPLDVVIANAHLELP